VIQLSKTLQLPAITSVYASATMPAANEQAAGKLVRVKDTDRSEELRRCMQAADGTWHWETVFAARAE
jgi:hypothetical protein